VVVAGITTTAETITTRTAVVVDITTTAGMTTTRTAVVEEEVGTKTAVAAAAAAATVATEEVTVETKVATADLLHLATLLPHSPVQEAISPLRLHSLPVTSLLHHLDGFLHLA
jgi:hypothetical protein